LLRGHRETPLPVVEKTDSGFSHGHDTHPAISLAADGEEMVRQHDKRPATEAALSLWLQTPVLDFMGNRAGLFGG
jgi:hypothetical protein